MTRMQGHLFVAVLLALLSALLTVDANTDIKIKDSEKHEAQPGRLPIDYTLPSAYIPYNRPAGTLLLNMLVKNEYDNLKRTLPQWAKLPIDCYIIGIDEHNTDDSVNLIKQHLGHIDNGIIHTIYNFSSIGESWNELVQLGIEKFSDKCTHGILADADFMPLFNYGTFDKSELDIRCSKHMYTIHTQDHSNSRYMDWIYRNIKGARVTRRTHQILEVPQFPDQEVFQTLVNLHIEEREGGYGDRSGNKADRYVSWLLADLEDYPGDTRTLYYIAYAYYDKFTAGNMMDLSTKTPEQWNYLKLAVEYFIKRTDIKDTGNAEERWFAVLKLGEIYERYYSDWGEAEKYYKQCIEADNIRADPYFYIGQHYRLVQQYETAVPYLTKAATLPIPQRSLFQWNWLYQCLSNVELGRAVNALQQPTLQKLRTAKKLLKQSICDGDDKLLDERKTLFKSIALKIKQLKDSTDTDSHTNSIKTAAVRDNDNSDYNKNVKVAINDAGTDVTEPLIKIDSADSKKQSDTNTVTSNNDAHSERIDIIWRLLDILSTQYSDSVKSILTTHASPTGTTNIYPQLQHTLDTLQLYMDAVNIHSKYDTCKHYKTQTAPYNKFVKKHKDVLNQLFADQSFYKRWTIINTKLKAACD